MTAKNRPAPNCSIARTLELVGDRWSFLILREAHNGITRFADFRTCWASLPTS
ncbi:winged helix-turn-helix transcriptional regulator [Leifsonia sp. L25]|uniref:winged helix-turn-helix transcriptional regulator n=1 Tax=Leifsonia sp. L25 TaxID=3423957 RepID=UPI003D688C5D